MEIFIKIMLSVGFTWSMRNEPKFILQEFGLIVEFEWQFDGCYNYC